MSICNAASNFENQGDKLIEKFTWANSCNCDDKCGQAWRFQAWLQLVTIHLSKLVIARHNAISKQEIPSHIQEGCFLMNSSTCLGAIHWVPFSSHVMSSNKEFL
jgi:hypothetical protein